MLNIWLARGLLPREERQSGARPPQDSIALHTDDLATIANLNKRRVLPARSPGRRRRSNTPAGREAADRGDAAQTVSHERPKDVLSLSVAEEYRRAARSAPAVRADRLAAALCGASSILLAFDQLGQRDSVACYLQRPNLAPLHPRAERRTASHPRNGSPRTLPEGRTAKASPPRAAQEVMSDRLTPMHRLYGMIGLNHARLGNFREAFDNTREAYLLQDSLFTHTVQQELSDLTVRYRTQEKELEIARLRQAEAEQQSRTMKRTAAFSAALSGLMLLVILALPASTPEAAHRETRTARPRTGREFADFLPTRLARKYIDGLESERERLARELHDRPATISRDRDAAQASGRRASHASHPAGEEPRQPAPRLRLMPPVFRYAALDSARSYIAHAPHPPRCASSSAARTGSTGAACERRLTNSIASCRRSATSSATPRTEVEVTLEAAGGRFR
ncbi:MAG: hypothetical protein ACLS37_11310 [Alistipes sp.]